MSADSTPSDASVKNRLSLGDASVSYHHLAVGSLAVLMTTYLSVLFHVTDIVGGTTTLLGLVAATLLAGTLIARRLRPKQAVVLAAVLLALGLVGYYLAVPSAYLVAMSLGKVVSDNVALLTGLSVLRMTEVGAWALGVAPAMVFAPWYLVLRRRYALAVGAAGTAMGFFVLTGDLSSFLTLVGMLAVTATLGFGTLARRGGTPEQVDTLAVVLVAMILLASTVTLVPGGGASPILPGGGGTPTVEDAFVSNGERMSIVGSIRLSPKVRFTVESEEPGYWRVGAYDRYDGNGWIRTGEARDYGPQPAPPGRSRAVEQTVTVKAERMAAMPAMWRPTRLESGDRDNTRVSPLGAFDPVGALREGEQYTVVSRVPDPSERQLRDAGTDYPARIENRYLQLPGSSEDRIRQRTNRVVEAADAETPYEKATAIEGWLESNKSYSLEVSRPDGNIAESFIFEMESGYCTYYATSMVTMLRSQGVPARFAVGYVSGQRVAEDEWVVRGLDSHAWVEVYFPDVGWVRFDPTPGGPREQAESSQIEAARQSNVSNVDTDESEEGTWTPTTTETTTVSGGNETTSPDGNATTVPSTPASGGLGDRQPINPGRGASNETFGGFTTTSGGTVGEEEDDESGGIPIGPPSREQTILGGLVAVGLLAAGRRSGTLERLRRAVWLRWQPREDPETDVSRAFDRLEYLLGREHRERRPGETPREYLTALEETTDLDDRATRVGSIYEQVRYAGDADDGLADEAVSLVDELVSDRRGLLGAR
ncbi:transglutaminase TgpA family protein [Halorussus ruber]|uniref:transglutaminase TgpA family protein n=1 Tax=Halorussus ruber TaxID=1126238 RepID=UPI001092B9E1|nr:transglutaminaseTgpA domain-containing protein [Halorussus ruber]